MKLICLYWKYSSVWYLDLIDLLKKKMSVIKDINLSTGGEPTKKAIFKCFYTSTKSWWGYIFITVSLFVCLFLCLWVCLSVNNIPAERMHRFGQRSQWRDNSFFLYNSLLARFLKLDIRSRSQAWRWLRSLNASCFSSACIWFQCLELIFINPLFCCWFFSFDLLMFHLCLHPFSFFSESHEIRVKLLSSFMIWWVFNFF